MNKRTWLRCSIILLWLATMAWHFMPPIGRVAVAGYADLLGDDVLIKDTWHKIYFAGEPAGISNTQIDFDEESDDERYVMKTLIEMTLSIMGTLQTAIINSTVTINAQHELTSFDFELDNQVYTMTITGKRLSGRTYEITTGNQNNSTTSRVTLPEGAVFSNPMQGLQLSRLAVGKTTSFPVFDPIALTTRTCDVKALRKETITVEGKKHDTTVLESNLGDIQVMSWINSDGDTVRQETPFGRYELCDFQQAMTFARRERSGEGLLARLAVQSSRPIDQPRDVRNAVYRLEGADLELNELSTDRQQAVRAEDGAVELTVHAYDFGDLTYDQIELDLDPWLEATRFIQSDDERLKNRALEITRGTSNHREAAVAIGRWVFENVRKTPAVSIPSALDVLESLEGDCNEHTYLFAGLARSIGIPTRIIVGIVYMNEAFYYHAWPAVYTGNGVWTEMDPTFGQTIADATHIAITEGEIDKQMEIMRLPGRLRIGVVSTSTELFND